MSSEAFRQLAENPRYATILRYLYAAPDGVTVDVLPEDEQLVIGELASRGVVDVRDGRAMMTVRDASLLELLRSSENGASAADAEMSELLSYLQELTSRIIHSNSIADLFQSAFKSLSTTIDFDVSAAVLIEQNLDVFLSRRQNFRKMFNEGLDDKIRAILERQIPVSFSSTDLVIQTDFADLPAREEPDDSLREQAFALLRQEHRPAGVLILYRGERPFTAAEQRILEFFANQVSIILGSIRAHEQILNLADTDDMTGIWNKRYFRRQLPFEVERSRIYKLPLSLLMFDVDNFKEINDTFGHPMGDVVLSELCGMVRESLRQPDLFARFGGDEFAVILPHTDYAGAECVADRILTRVRNLAIPGDGNSMIRCSLSMGIATYVPPEMTATDLLRQADERLYIAKKSGKNRYA